MAHEKLETDGCIGLGYYGCPMSLTKEAASLVGNVVGQNVTKFFVWKE